MQLPSPKTFSEGETITQTGLYRIDEAIYHADALCETPSLSSTIARKLLNESPLHAWHAHPRLNPEQEEKTAATLDMGKVVHAMLLGEGRDVEILEYADYKTKAAREERDYARSIGKVPMLREHYDLAGRLVSVIHGQVAQYPDLAGLFSGGTLFEVSAVWQEERLWCRSMLDMVRLFPDFLAIFDFKSTDRTAAPMTIGRQVFNMGYDVQFAFYRRGLRRALAALGMTDCPPIRCFLMTQERAGPGALSIVEPDEQVLELADKKIAAALQVWDTCLKADEWPSYPPFIEKVVLPPWMETQWLEREVRDDALAGAGYRFAVPMEDPEGDPSDPDVLAAG